MNYKKSDDDKESWIINFNLALSLKFIGIAFIALVLFTFPIFFSSYTIANMGALGDLFGGIFNPLIAISAALLTFLAFYVQYKANDDVRKQFKIQQFESQLYEMLKLHRANIDEMDINNKLVGRKCFVRMFYEFKYIYLSLFNLHKAHNVNFNWNFNKEEFCNISYLVFFYGIGSISNRVVLKRLDEKYHPLTLLLIDYLEEGAVNEWNNSANDYVEIAIDNEDGQTVFVFEMFYYPFDGHNSRLGHYFRHLYQTVSFVVNSDVINERSTQYKYLKLLRAQLSNHEQLLLYYNSLTKFGNGWLENKFFTDYKMIKNIPLDFADFGVLPGELLGHTNDLGELIFEWDEY